MMYSAVVTVAEALDTAVLKTVDAPDIDVARPWILCDSVRLDRCPRSTGFDFLNEAPALAVDILEILNWFDEVVCKQHAVPESCCARIENQSSVMLGTIFDSSAVVMPMALHHHSPWS